MTLIKIILALLGLAVLLPILFVIFAASIGSGLATTVTLLVILALIWDK